jgi:uncharacterized membrane protein YbjE (DUF340 family)
LNIAADCSHVGECVISQSIDLGIALSAMNGRPSWGWYSVASVVLVEARRLDCGRTVGQQLVGHRSAELDA